MATLGGVRATYYRDRRTTTSCGGRPPQPASTAERVGVVQRSTARRSSTPRRRHYGPDVIGLLGDNTSYGVKGDHGGAQESVQRIPIVFYGAGVKPGAKPSDAIRSVDITPTILRELGIDLPAGLDGTAYAASVAVSSPCQGTGRRLPRRSRPVPLPRSQWTCSADSVAGTKSSWPSRIEPESDKLLRSTMSADHDTRVLPRRDPGRDVPQRLAPAHDHRVLRGVMGLAGRHRRSPEHREARQRDRQHGQQHDQPTQPGQSYRAQLAPESPRRTRRTRVACEKVTGTVAVLIGDLRGRWPGTTGCAGRSGR